MTDGQCYSVPPEPNTIVGCGCLGASTRWRVTVRLADGLQTSIVQCCACGDARRLFVPPVRL